MATDFREIELTDEQKRRVAELAQETGRHWKEILDESLFDRPDSDPDADLGRYKDPYIHDPEKRKAFFEEWLAQQTSHNPNFDDSRESIYFGQD